MVTSLIDVTNVLSVKSCLKYFLSPWLDLWTLFVLLLFLGLNLIPQEHSLGLPSCPLLRLLGAWGERSLCSRGDLG